MSHCSKVLMHCLPTYMCVCVCVCVTECRTMKKIQNWFGYRSTYRKQPHVWVRNCIPCLLVLLNPCMLPLPTTPPFIVLHSSQIQQWLFPTLSVYCVICRHSLLAIDVLFVVWLCVLLIQSLSVDANDQLALWTFGQNELCSSRQVCVCCVCVCV